MYGALNLNFILQEMQESREDHFDSQQKHLHSSHGSLYAASQVIAA